VLVGLAFVLVGLAFVLVGVAFVLVDLAFDLDALVITVVSGATVFALRTFIVDGDSTLV
jgi:hypothetical protein